MSPTSTPDKDTTPIRTKKERWMIMTRIIILSVILGYNSIACVFFDAFLPDIMVQFGVAKTKSESGKSAAFLTAGFCLGRLISSSLWGAFADTYGRKAGLLILLGLLSLCTFMFGFCTSFYATVAMRTLSGFLNGIPVVGKTISMEICPNEFKSWSISVTNTIWSTGTILGPVFGSLLYKGMWADSYPMLLSSIVVGTLGLLLIPVAWYVFEETLPPKPTPNRAGFKKQNDEESIAEEPTQDNIKLVEPQSSPSSSPLSILKIPNVAKLILIFSFNTFMATLFSGLLIFWVSAKYEDGGLDFAYKDISQIFLYFLVPQLILQILLYPLFQNKIGDFKLLSLGHWIYLPIFFCIPLAHAFGEGAYTSQKVYIVFWLFIRNMASFMNFSALQRFTNDVITPENRGKLYGIQGMFASGLQIFSPIIGKGILSLSLTMHLPFPFDYHFVFLLVCALTLIVLTCIYRLQFKDGEKKKLVGET